MSTSSFFFLHVKFARKKNYRFATCIFNHYTVFPTSCTQITCFSHQMHRSVGKDFRTSATLNAGSDFMTHTSATHTDWPGFWQNQQQTGLLKIASFARRQLVMLSILCSLMLTHNKDLEKKRDVSWLECRAHALTPLLPGAPGCYYGSNGFHSAALSTPFLIRNLGCKWHGTLEYVATPKSELFYACVGLIEV